MLISLREYIVIHSQIKVAVIITVIIIIWCKAGTKPALKPISVCDLRETALP